MARVVRISILILMTWSPSYVLAYDGFWGKDGGVYYALKAYNHIKDNCAKDNLDHLYQVLKLTKNPQCKLWNEVTKWKLKWYIASDDDTVVLTFRGTANETNKKLNQRGKPSTKHRGMEGVLTHEGWADAVHLIWPDIIGHLKEIKAEKKRVMVTGHSLGGPLSGYTMFRLLRGGRFIKGGDDVLVTTGSPRYAGASLCANPDFAIKYADLLSKTGTAAFSVEMWHDPTIYTWTDGNAPICTANRIGFSVNFDPRDDPEAKGKIRRLMESVAGNYCNARSVHPRPINFHNHQRYTRIGALKKDQLAIGFYLWPGDICVPGVYDKCVHGSCVATSAAPVLYRCAQRTVVPKAEEKKKGCDVVPDGKKWPKRHWLRHRVEFPECGGFSSNNSCPPYHQCSVLKGLHCVPN